MGKEKASGLLDEKGGGNYFWTRVGVEWPPGDPSYKERCGHPGLQRRCKAPLAGDFAARIDLTVLTLVGADAVGFYRWGGARHQRRSRNQGGNERGSTSGRIGGSRASGSGRNAAGTKKSAGI